MIREKSCGAVVYSVIDNEFKYLIVQMNLGHYGFAKGHVEDGETEVQTALREIKEETGLSVTINTDFRESLEYSPYEGCMKEVVFFVASANDVEVVPQPEEIKSIQWLSYELAQKTLTFENDRDILRKANEFIELMYESESNK